MILTLGKTTTFLIYRVELKLGHPNAKDTCGSSVPDLPCGVESPLVFEAGEGLLGFLIYRVELKVGYT